MQDKLQASDKLVAATKRERDGSRAQVTALNAQLQRKAGEVESMRTTWLAPRDTEALQQQSAKSAWQNAELKTRLESLSADLLQACADRDAARERADQVPDVAGLHAAHAKRLAALQARVDALSVRCLGVRALCCMSWPSCHVLLAHSTAFPVFHLQWHGAGDCMLHYFCQLPLFTADLFPKCYT